MAKNQVRCMECGSLVSARQETISFEKAIGLPGVYLHTLVTRCAKCGAFEIMVPNLDGLHHAVARSRVEKQERLSGAEVRFLRKLLGWSGVDFAEHMGTSAETVSRWENGSTPIGPQADRLLRLMVMTRDPIADYRRLDLLKTVAKSRPAKVRIVAKPDSHGDWSVKAMRAA